MKWGYKTLEAMDSWGKIDPQILIGFQTFPCFQKNSLALQKGAAQPSHGKKSMFFKKNGRPLLKNMLCIPTNERIGSNPHFLHGWPLLMLLWWKL